jgi:DNA-binding MarR family transcriptional regulator
MQRTHKGQQATEIVLSTFRANGLLLAAGDELAATEGLTSARWQVLGAIALAERSLTVPQIARRMGLTRQAVQASVNRLRRDGLVVVSENPDHRRSPLVQLTRRGAAKYAAVDRKQAAWINELAKGLTLAELNTAAAVLHELCNRLEAAPNAADRRGDGHANA